jgi:threonine 3-dehydrogenase
MHLTWLKHIMQSNHMHITSLNISRIYIPSTIAVFGPDVPKENVPNSIPLNPRTIYGVTKVFMENMANYYHYKYGVDFRSIRYPGVISPMEYESHGTTDYASQIFISALKGEEYSICLSPQTTLPMVYLDDVLSGTVRDILLYFIFR